MADNIQSLWILYILIVAILTAAFVSSWGVGMAWSAGIFLALFIGAIIVFLLSAGINMDELDTSDKNTLGLLLVIAYVLPILAALWAVFESSFPRVKKSIVEECDQAGNNCQIVKEKTVVGDTKVKSYRRSKRLAGSARSSQ